MDPTELQQLCEGRAPQWAKVRLGMMGDFPHQIRRERNFHKASLRGFKNTGKMMGLVDVLDIFSGVVFNAGVGLLDSHDLFFLAGFGCGPPFRMQL